MSVPSTFFESIFSRLDSSLSGFWGNAASDVASAIAPAAASLLTFYVIFYGLSMVRGLVEEPVTDMTFRFIRLVIVYALAINMGIYNTYIGDLMWNGPDQMAQIISGAAASGRASFLDSLFTQFGDMATLFETQAFVDTSYGVPNLALLFYSIVIWGAGCLLCGYAAFLFTLSKIALAILLGVGPLFVLMSMFEATKKFTEAWTGQVVNYFFHVVLTSATVKLIFTIIQSYMVIAVADAAEPGTRQVVPVVLFAIVGCLVLMQIGSIASALGGGATIGTLGAGKKLWGMSKDGMGAAKDEATGKARTERIAGRKRKASMNEWAKANPSAGQKLYRKITGSDRNKVAKG